MDFESLYLLQFMFSPSPACHLVLPPPPSPAPPPPPSFHLPFHQSCSLSYSLIFYLPFSLPPVCGWKCSQPVFCSRVHNRPSLPLWVLPPSTSECQTKPSCVSGFQSKYLFMTIEKWLKQTAHTQHMWLARRTFITFVLKVLWVSCCLI